MKKIALAFLIAISLVSCTSPDKAMTILEREGYESIEIRGYDAFGCSEDDFYHTGFTAEKNNQVVNGVVCSGLFKGSTIRLYD